MEKGTKPSAPVLVTGICVVCRFSALNWSKDQDGECKKFVAVRHLKKIYEKYTLSQVSAQVITFTHGYKYVQLESFLYRCTEM